MLLLEQLYGDVDNLRGLVHPEWQRGFEYMGNAAVIELAQELTECIVESGIDMVLVSETGASPFAEVCEKILSYERRSIKFRRMKFPREPLASIFPVLSSFLSSAEKAENLSLSQRKSLEKNQVACCFSLEAGMSRLGALQLLSSLTPTGFFETGPADVCQLLSRVECDLQSPFQQAVSVLFQGTEIASQLASPFIYLDEYIDSGTTLRNAIAFFRCLTPCLRFKTASYYINLPELAPQMAVELAPQCALDSDCCPITVVRTRGAKTVAANVLYTRYSTIDKPGCYEAGAYPFENRVDLIGHFYRIDETDCVRKTILSIEEAFANASASYETFLVALFKLVKRERLLEIVLERLTLEAVRSFITIEHVVRGCILELEKVKGEPDYVEFLFQLFDMYGPAWSPMPVAFHFDFWRGFAGFDEFFCQVPQFESLASEYGACRESILKRLAQICLRRRAAWLTDVHTRLERIYG